MPFEVWRGFVPLCCQMKLTGIFVINPLIFSFGIWLWLGAASFVSTFLASWIILTWWKPYPKSLRKRYFIFPLPLLLLSLCLSSNAWMNMSSFLLSFKLVSSFFCGEEFIWKTFALFFLRLPRAWFWEKRPSLQSQIWLVTVHFFCFRWIYIASKSSSSL